MRLQAYLPDPWSGKIQQIQILNQNALKEKEHYAYLLTKAPAWLVTPSQLGEGDDFVANHLQPVAGFSKPNSEIRVMLYKVKGR